MTKLERLLYTFTYAGWFLILIAFIVFIHLVITQGVWGIILGVLILICAMLIAEGLKTDYLSENKLYKYRHFYSIKIFTINNVKYYFPVLTVITSSGELIECILKKHVEAFEKECKYTYNHHRLADVAKSIKKDYKEINDLFNDNFCFKSPEEAQYVIAECEKQVNQYKKAHKSINDETINISFN